MKRQAAKVTTWIFILSLILAVAVSSQDPAGTQYLALRGRTGGQVAQGGKAAGDDLVLQSTEHPTKGDVILANDGSGLILPTLHISGAGHLSGLDADTVDGLHAFELGGGGGYTNEMAQDAVGTIFIDSPTIDFTYDDATPSIRADVIGGGGGDCFSDPNCAYLDGRAGGQDLIGDTQASGFLGLRATSHASGGTVFIQTGGTGTTEIGGSPNGNVDIYGPLHWNLLNTDGVKLRADGDTLDNLLCVNCTPDKVGIGTASPSVQLDIVGAAKASTSLTTPIVYGSSSASANLVLDSTSSGFKGNVNIAPSGGFVLIGAQTDVTASISATKNWDQSLSISVNNADTGTSAFSTLAAANGGTFDDALRLVAVGTGYSSSGTFVADTGLLRAGSGLSGGLSIQAENATTGDIRFYTGGTTERLKISAAGIFTGAGTGSGLDADLLDGQHGSFYTSASNITTGSLPFARIQVSAASKLLGRGSASGAGDMQEITLGTNLSMSGTTLNATGGGGGSAHVIQDEGTSLTARANLNFTGVGVDVTDNAGSGTTVVSIPGIVIATADAGLAVTYVDPNSVSLVPSGADAKARLTLYDSSAATWKLFEIPSTETASLACSGSANCLDTGSEAASSFYHLWAIGKLDNTFDLLLSLSASAPTMPSGYTFKGLIGGVANDATSNIVQFQQLSDGRFMYTAVQVSVRGLNVLNAGAATAATAISLAKAIPDIPGVAYGMEVTGTNASATNSALTVSEDSAQTTLIMAGRTVGTTGAVINSEHWDVTARNTGNRTTSLYYKWSVAATQTSSVWVKWWSFGRTAGAGASSGPNFSDDESITGTIDGSNATFTLAHDPNPDASLQFVLNGVVLKRTVGYTLSGTTVTMASGYVPGSGSVLSAFFRY